MAHLWNVPQNRYSSLFLSSIYRRRPVAASDWASWVVAHRLRGGVSRDAVCIAMRCRGSGLVLLGQGSPASNASAHDMWFGICPGLTIVAMALALRAVTDNMAAGPISRRCLSAPARPASE